MLLPSRSLRTTTIALLSLGIPAACMASEDHVVSTIELRQQIQSSAQTRNSNLQQTQALLSSPQVDKILHAAKMDPAKIQGAVAGLNDDELARIASRADKIQADI